MMNQCLFSHLIFSFLFASVSSQKTSYSKMVFQRLQISDFLKLLINPMILQPQWWVLKLQWHLNYLLERNIPAKQIFTGKKTNINICLCYLLIINHLILLIFLSFDMLLFEASVSFFITCYKVSFLLQQILIRSY